MTKKHYEAIADVLRNCVEAEKNMCNGVCTDKLAYIAEHLAEYFASDNPRFNRERFLKACGVA